MVARKIEDLDSEEEIVKDKPFPVEKPKELKIRGAAKRLSESRILQRKNIKAKIVQFVKDKESIQQLETRRQKYIQEILPYIQENLTGIYRLDNEPVTYNQLKHKYLKKLFPTESSAIIFQKKYLRHHH